MPKPLIELYGPRQRGNTYAVAARIHLADGDLELVARAPKAVIAGALARLQALIVYHHGAELSLAGAKHVIARNGFQVSGRRVYVGRDLSRFWDGVDRCLEPLAGDPVFRATLAAAAGAAVHVTPVLAIRGIGPRAIDAGAELVTQMAPPAGDVGAELAAGRAAAKSRYVLIKAAANATDTTTAQAGKLAQLAVTVPAKILRQGGVPALKGYRAMGRAAQLVRGAGSEPDTQAHIAELVALARMGQEQAIEAVAYLVAARAMLLELLDLVERARAYQADDWYDEDCQYDDGYYDEPDTAFEPDEFAEYEYVVGAQLGRAVADAELVGRLKEYRRRPQGWRPIAEE